ncbi:MAG: cold shock domain-containing protein [Acidimicrobiales bacterium]|nr:cold shock domain-containing protein [Acidimicrobiales bacterium]
MTESPQDLAAVFSVRSGTVTAFDGHVGSGVVTDERGEEWPFHCTSIADGSRTIATATPVRFTVRPGPNGLEAFDLAPTVPAER